MFPTLIPRIRNTQTQTTKTRNLFSFQSINVTPLAGAILRIVRLFGSPLLICCAFSMSRSDHMFYQVMGATRCPKPKKHPGIKLRPISRAKEPFMPNDVIIYSCESLEYTQSIKCLDDGRWTEIPHCPDPTNFTCPELGPIDHGTYNASGPHKVNTVVAFRCDNEPWRGFNPASLAASNTTNTAAYPSINFTNNIDLAITKENSLPTRYNLTGHRLLKCLPSAKWNHPPPTCTAVYPDTPSRMSFVLTSAILILIPILILVTIVHLFVRWRKRQQQRARWKQYFTDYKYRHSKTSITFGMRPPSANATIPVTDL